MHKIEIRITAVIVGILFLFFFASCAPKSAAPDTDGVGTTAKTEVNTEIDTENENNGGAKLIPIIIDTEFKNGFICSGAAHEDGIVGELNSPAGTGSPNWKCCQWACKYDITQGVYTADETGYSYTTESQKVAVSWKEGEPLLILELKASKEYDMPRVYGQAWPHLLIEQQDLAARCPKLDKVESLNLILETRVAYCGQHMEKADPSLHAAQISLFFTVQSNETGDMYWFGVPIYDNRQKFLAEFMAEDGGKEDASHKFIFTVSQKRLTAVSPHEFTKLRYEADLMPHIKRGLEQAHKAGYLNSDNLASYTLTTCNMGYELPGIFDSAFELYEFALNAVLY